MTRDVVAKLNDRTDRVVADLRAEWGTGRTLEEIEYGPIPWHRDAPPDSVEEQVEEFAGMAAVVPFRSDRRREVVLVYQRSGHWVPPGGAIEGGRSPAETAVMEAREEAGIEVELTDLLYTRRVRYRYEDGITVELPAVTFVGRETDGELRPERAGSNHPYACHGVGVFGRDVVPEDCRDRDHLIELFDGLPPYDPWPPSLEDESTAASTDAEG